MAKIAMNPAVMLARERDLILNLPFCLSKPHGFLTRRKRVGVIRG
jgi:hypothetical protein